MQRITKKYYFSLIQKVDNYDCLHINPQSLDKYLVNQSLLKQKLEQILQDSINKNLNAIWLRLDKHQLNLSQLISDLGFQMHHCTQEYLLFSLWLQKEPSRLPNYASHKIILQYYLINSKNQIFLIDDKMPIQDVDDSSLIPIMAQTYFKQNYNINIQPLYICDLNQSINSNIMITLKCQLLEQERNQDNFVNKTISGFDQRYEINSFDKYIIYKKCL
ncbi:unnamed protein product [Paramecium pentaurelia]|uniref:Pre-nudix hydrolase domain-containing protein n=1 Tax=Paramecium pentaurelia TaxID=43138 RepID=A0A8S1TJX3_9CILI|nr:unnamed protein product [Paramecium pentaurelia]